MSAECLFCTRLFHNQKNMLLTKISIKPFQIGYENMYRACFSKGVWFSAYAGSGWLHEKKDPGKYFSELINDDLTKLAILYDKEAIGFCHALSHGHQIYELSGGIIPKYIGQGIGSVALRQIVAFCFEALGAHRLFSFIRIDNKRSRLMAEKIGFKIEGILNQHYCTKDTNEYVDMCVYGFLLEEYEKITDHNK